MYFKSKNMLKEVKYDAKAKYMLQFVKHARKK